jgi:ribokinase
VGSVNVDLQARAERWPGPGETLPVRDFLLVGGGKAANVAVLARRLGADAALAARVGDDPLAEIALGPLRDAGVDLGGVRAAEGCHTGVSMITVRDDGEKTILLADNANGRWERERLDDLRGVIEKAPRGSVLTVDLEVPSFVVSTALDAAASRGLVRVLDPSPGDRVTDELLERAEWVTPNPGEAARILDHGVEDVDDAFEAAAELCRRGARYAVVKMGAEGSVLVGDGVREHVPAIEVEPVDTTGAGDAFAGALSVALLEGRRPVEAVRFAVVVSALAVTGYGSQQAYPARRDVDARLG